VTEDIKKIKRIIMNKNPTVSVIIPTYNRAHLVGRAIQSVLNQTYKDFELIIVDDGSTDNTKEAVKEFQKKDKRIRYIRHKENKGGSATRNTGIRVANGEYIAFLDSDDEWLSEKLERQIGFFEQSTDNIGIVYCGYQYISDRTEKIISEKPPYKKVFNEIDLVNMYKVKTSTILIKKPIVSKIIGFDPLLESFQDWDFSLRVAKHCTFRQLSDILVRCYVHEDRITSNIKAKIRGLERVLEKHLAKFTKDPRAFSNQQRFLGSLYCQFGDTKRGRVWFSRSIQYNWFNWRTYFYYILSLGGSEVYKLISNVAHSRNRKVFKS